MSAYYTEFESPEGKTERFVAASFGKRFLATLLDTVVYFALLALIYSIARRNSIKVEDWLASLLEFVISTVAYLGFWYYLGATPGKQLLGLRIVDAQSGRNLSIPSGLKRYLGYFVSLLPFCIGFFAMLWDKKKQCWHDKIGHSLVVQEADIEQVYLHNKAR